MNNKKAYTLLSILLCFTPFFLLCFYISPSGDDYSYAWVGASSTDFLGTLIGEWNTWNGRYISNVFVLINPIAYGRFDLYQMIPLLLIMLFIVAQSLLVLQFISTSKTRANTMSACFILIYLNVMPHIGEGIYWYTAAVTYFAPLVLFPLHLILLNMFSKPNQSLLIIALILLQFLLTGFNEVIMIVMTLLHLGFVIWSKNNKKAFWLLLLTQLLFSAIVYFAPGNEVRSSYFPNKHDVIHTILNGSANTLRFTASLLGTPSLWISMLLFVKMGFNSKKYTASIWFWTGIFFIPQFIACAGPVWTTGMIGQHRTPNFALYFQILIVFMFLLFENEHKITTALKQISTFTSFPKLLVGLVISFLLLGNGRTAIEDLLSRDAWEFNQESIARANSLESLSNLQDTMVFIPAYRYKPKSIFIYDITSNSKDWKNEAYTSYYGLKQQNVSIRCKP
jgi:hypothetical protein